MLPNANARSKMKWVALYRALSKLGLASRTQAQELIALGEITVDGAICCNPNRLVCLETTSIIHNNQTIKKAQQVVYILYKPRSIITSRKDEDGRPTVYTLLPPNLHHLHCVGRLDFATSGLLILTNDTMLSSWLTDPANGVLRVYTVTVRGLFTPENALSMQNGITDDNQKLQTSNILVRKASKRESHLVLTLTEGKNREIRRMCKAVGHEVTRLKRVSYGGLELGNLQPGEFRQVSDAEILAAFPQAR